MKCDPIQKVFDSKDLRHRILTCYVKLKYDEEIKHGIITMFTESLMKRWYHFCGCEICETCREYHIATYGELI